MNYKEALEEAMKVILETVKETKSINFMSNDWSEFNGVLLKKIADKFLYFYKAGTNERT